MYESIGYYVNEELSRVLPGLSLSFPEISTSVTKIVHHIYRLPSRKRMSFLGLLSFIYHAPSYYLCFVRVKVEGRRDPSYSRFLYFRASRVSSSLRHPSSVSRRREKNRFFPPLMGTKRF